jgi:hypothetical protein
MGFVIGLILFGIPSVLVAGYKGFKPLRWIIAFGLIGLIVVAALPSAKAKNISSEEADKRAEKANKIGGWMAGINLVTGVIAIIIVLIANS